MGALSVPHIEARTSRARSLAGGGSFRGFVEFAVIGSVILAFLPGHSDFGAIGAFRSLIKNQFGGSSDAPINPLPRTSSRNRVGS